MGADPADASELTSCGGGLPSLPWAVSGQLDGACRLSWSSARLPGAVSPAHRLPRSDLSGS